MKGKIDYFVLAIIAMIIVAYLFPDWGIKTSPVPLTQISSVCISLIFFFYGLKLNPEKIKTGLKNWKLHVLVQLSTFLLFPLLVLPFYPFMKGEAHAIWLAFMFLAALPSAVSSSVVMVSLARGNVPAAIFNASLSGLIGVVITPLWMGLFIEKTSGQFHLGAVYTALVVEIILPLTLGVLLQRYWGSFAVRHSASLSLFDKSVILMIIYKSFAESFETHVFATLRLHILLLMALAVLVLFFLVYHLTGFIARKAGFNREDEITATFCGTKKSLIHGTVFSKILFPASIPGGLILLPLMLFHAMQIFIISIIATRIRKTQTEIIH